MNFFGHAALAARFSSSPYVALGSMLPDFCSMLSSRVPALLHPELAVGVSLHHATDHLFHEHPEFLARSRLAHAELSAAGVTRGAARAVSHIGIELLFDEQLAEAPEAVSVYRSALAARIGPELFTEARLQEPLRELLQLLLERSYTRRPASAEQVTERIRRALASRPRLALQGTSDLAGVQNWVVTTQPRILGCAVQIVADLEAALTLGARAGSLADGKLGEWIERGRR